MVVIPIAYKAIMKIMKHTIWTTTTAVTIPALQTAAAAEAEAAAADAAAADAAAAQAAAAAADAAAAQAAAAAADAAAAQAAAAASLEAADAVWVEANPGTVKNAVGSSTPGCEPDCFIPSTIAISTGDTVTWENTDNAAHTATSGSATDGSDGVLG